MNTCSINNNDTNIMCLSFKTVVPNKLISRLEQLYQKSLMEVEKMIKNREQKSSKYYKEIPCVLAKSLITKYQRNKKLKKITNMVLPVCGDKGKQIKIINNGLKITALFKKEIIPVRFPKPIIGFIRNVEFFKRNKIWYMSYSYNTPALPGKDVQNFIGVDRNSVGNVVTIADSITGKVRKFGPDTSSITKNFRNRRRNLQKKGAKLALKKN